MHIVLTHEQADFDALASLLGAHLLLETAIPVLPRRMNRNVRAFWSLYGAELPFVDPRDLRTEPIEKVTLVDTQSLVSVRGMGAETWVEVIDHHPQREGAPAEWKITTQDVGATATILVEALQDRNGPLSPIHATLMLIGIYEDTGSLTYTRTTPRDLRAAAALLEQGASLTIAADFLNHPLSPAQQAIYDRLRQSAEHLRIHGHSVVIASASALEMEEELSSIVHKLRDLMDPDAIFVLVTTRAGVQLIARSTSDQIDVAEVAARLGGGGHERASAGLIRNRDLESVRHELDSLLLELIHPAVTVGKIMSYGLQMLSPNTPVEEANRRMRLFGYEGYPVVADGQVVGLVTRRGVDRAMSYNYKVPVEKIMEAGSYTVTPGDPIEVVQRLVTETGWGQIPVVDPETGKILGIVTRTDLLKNLSPGQAAQGRMNVAARLEKALPPDRLKLLRAVAEVASVERAALYLVGGFVRDLIMERPSLDFDLVVEGDAIVLAQALARKYGGRVTGHSRFGTAKWRLESKPGEMRSELTPEGLTSIDLVTARTEFYTHPTALPTIERGSIKLDLHRRDFTINTMAVRLDGRHWGELHDHWGGLEDLRNGLVRVLHSLSFVDDPTRILRAARFEQRFAFQIEPRTLQLLLEARPMIERLSGDRIRHELNHILASHFASQILGRLNQLDLLAVIHPDLPWDEWVAARIEGLPNLVVDPDWEVNLEGESLHQELGYVIWLMTLPLEISHGIIRRLKLPNVLAEIIESAAFLWEQRHDLADMTPSAAARNLEGAPSLARYALYQVSSDHRVRAVLKNYASEWRHITPTIDGHDLRRMGLPPGPIYRRILDRLRSAWLDGEVVSKEEESALLDSLILLES